MSAPPPTLPKPVRAMESGDTEKKPREQSGSTPVTQTEVTLICCTRMLCCELGYAHKIKMAYNREEVCGRGSELYFI